MESLKHCGRCETQLFLTAFGPCKAKRDGLMSWCKECQHQYYRERKLAEDPSYQPRIHRPKVPKYKRPKTPEERRHRRQITVMLASAKARARDGGFPFTIGRGDVVIPETCPVLGVRLECGTLMHHDHAPSLDRVDPKLGYVPGNVHVISCRANRIKTDATAEELRRVYEYVLRSVKWT